MAFNLEMQSILKKLNWLGFALVLPFQGIGCVSIQRSSPSGLRPVTNCSDFSNGVLDSEELYQLNDKREVTQTWDSNLDPSHLFPSQVTGWASNSKQRSIKWITNQCGRCANAKASVQEWIIAKKEKANAPPWPRFHPVPTQPVFEPSEKDPTLAPEVYGRFGKG